jgi:hypothetical protein
VAGQKPAPHWRTWCRPRRICVRLKCRIAWWRVAYQAYKISLVFPAAGRRVACPAYKISLVFPAAGRRVACPAYKISLVFPAAWWRDAYQAYKINLVFPAAGRRVACPAYKISLVFPAAWWRVAYQAYKIITLSRTVGPASLRRRAAFLKRARKTESNSDATRKTAFFITMVFVR